LEIANWPDIASKRFILDVEGYTQTDGDQSYFLTPYFGLLPENVDNNVKNLNPTQNGNQAYFVEQPPFSEVPAHFHDTNQFQVFLEGEAVFGKKQISSVAVHYANGHTPYGPIITKDFGINYLTLRNKWDSGGKKMPEKKDILQSVPRVFYLTEKIQYSDKDLDNHEVKVENIFWDKNTKLGIDLFYLPKDCLSNFALISEGFGRYCLILSGSLFHDGAELTEKSCIYFGVDEQRNFKSGKKGAVVLVMQFPDEVVSS